MEYPAPPTPPTYVSADTSALRGATFGQAVQRFWAKYATFDGRASRSEYWYAALANVLLYVVVEILVLSTKSGLLAVLVALLMLALIVPSISLAARRLHDIGKSGWWQLVGLIPLVGAILMIIWTTTPEKPEGDRYNI